MRGSSRIEKLSAMLEKDPADPFLRFAMGMEYKKAGQFHRAIEWFGEAREKDPNYCAAFFMAAQSYEAAGELDNARAMYREGIAAARRIGDAHAAAEMEEALSLIE